MTKIDRIWPDVAIPPGTILLDELEARGMSQKEFAERTGRPKGAINEIIKGKKQIIPETAIQFERVLGIPAHVWLNLENDYRYNDARLKDREKLLKESARLMDYPTAEMIRLGWIRKFGDKAEQTKELLSFWGVSSFEEVKSLTASFRISGRGEVNRNSLLCWLRRGQIEAQAIDTGEFDREGVLKSLEQLRRLTLQLPEVFVPQMKQICARVGIAVAVVPELRGIKTSGAAFWWGGKAVILLNLRYKRNDHFWFTFFHELSHVLFGKRRKAYRDPLHDETLATYVDIKEERVANRFARNVLIEPDDYKRLLELTPFLYSKIEGFARSIEIHPGIVVGRLQYEKVVHYSHFNKLKKKYTWAKAP